jgi:hypothetical protein
LIPALLARGQRKPSRLERLIQEDGLVGLRLSPIYDKDVVWFNDPVCYPLWKKAEELNATFNIFLAPHQVSQVADMAQRFPGVNIVIDHIAMIDITAPDSDGFGPLLNLERFPNVYIRTSCNLQTKQMPYPTSGPSSAACTTATAPSGCLRELLRNAIMRDHPLLHRRGPKSGSPHRVPAVQVHQR